ncbi:MAG: galactose-1-phosphate uridylyltransferase [Deltaproteobacteria bacterium]|nr:MAG: galactose-1-phosphate uridylyltransferase [Deltaproteobacteria bacterium]
MIRFERETVHARFVLPTGAQIEAPIEIRVNPITGRTSRIAFSRTGEREAATDSFPDPPPFAGDTAHCPFCSINLPAKTPQLLKTYEASGRMIRGASVLFPNLFPYGAHSAVSLFDDRHFVEIGTASIGSYTNSFRNCAEYLRRVRAQDPEAVYMAITQNHLPSAGGSLLHPHLQIQADRIPSNHQRFLKKRALRHFRQTDSFLLSDYLHHEKAHNQRYIGATGAWEWLAAFAPEGFFEIWGILPQATSMSQVTAAAWKDLAQGVLNTQRYYRSLNRNGYNLGMLAIENEASKLELRVVILARSNYAPWVRNDHTGFEVMLGDMATFTAPEDTATAARPFWNQTESIP